MGSSSFAGQALHPQICSRKSPLIRTHRHTTPPNPICPTVRPSGRLVPLCPLEAIFREQSYGVTVVFGNWTVVFGNSTVVFGNSAVVFGNWNGCIRKLGFGNCAVVFGNWYSEAEAVVFGNWKGGIRKLHGCIWKLVFGNYTVVFGNWYSETETVVFGNSTVVFGNSYSETRRLYSETAGPESLSSACISMAMPGKLL